MPAAGLRSVLLLATIAIGGCSSLGMPDLFRKDVPALNLGHENQVQAITSWRLAGRIGVQRKDQGFNGDLQWRQEGDAYDVRISAPLNGGTFLLQGTSGAVLMEVPDGDRYRAASAEELMLTHLGWSIPLTGASYWIRGVPDPARDVAQILRDEGGRYTDFAQDGWRISVLDYLDEQPPALPRKLYLTHEDLQVRVVVRRWERM